MVRPPSYEPAIARIPQLAIHLGRGVNDGLHDPRTHLMPIWSVDPVGESVVEHFWRLSGFDSALHGEMFALRHSASSASQLGMNCSLGRLDNLVSCWAAAAAPGHFVYRSIAKVVLNDHEGVGSAAPLEPGPSRTSAHPIVCMRWLRCDLAGLSADRCVS